jgi:putative transcriptional regulator
MEANMDANGAIFSGSLRRPGKVVVGRPSADDLDVRSIRLNADSLRVGFCAVTQQSFADAIGVPVKTLRNWEQGRRKPTGPALVLLSLIQRDPWIVFDVMNGQHRAPSA